MQTTESSHKVCHKRVCGPENVKKIVQSLFIVRFDTLAEESETDTRLYKPSRIMLGLFGTVVSTTKIISCRVTDCFVYSFL